MMRVVRDKLQRGDLKDVEAEIILRRQKDAEPDLHREGLSPEPSAPTRGEQVEAMCKEITVMLAELKTAPTDVAIVQFQGKPGNFDIIFGPFYARFSAPPHPARAVCCALLGANADRVLIGGLNPMLWPIWGFR